jgi:hypothetical protein
MIKTQFSWMQPKFCKVITEVFAQDWLDSTIHNVPYVMSMHYYILCCAIKATMWLPPL